MELLNKRDPAVMIIHDSTERWITTTCYLLGSWSFFKIEKIFKEVCLTNFAHKILCYVMKKLEELIRSNNSSSNNDNNSTMLRALIVNKYSLEERPTTAFEERWECCRKHCLLNVFLLVITIQLIMIRKALLIPCSRPPFRLIRRGRGGSVFIQVEGRCL